MTIKFLTKKFIIMEFPKRKSLFVQFSLIFRPPPDPLQNANFVSIVVFFGVSDKVQLQATMLLAQRRLAGKTEHGRDHPGICRTKLSISKERTGIVITKSMLGNCGIYFQTHNSSNFGSETNVTHMVGQSLDRGFTLAHAQIFLVLDPPPVVLSNYLHHIVDLAAT